jgi:spermidine/putrescine transport system ATP-binding protein
MNKGRYEQLGDPESLYERPTTRFVAGFLGVSNLLPGTITGTADDYAVVRLDDDTNVRVPKALTNGSTAVDVGVRPEKIRLVSEGSDAPSSSNLLSGVVRDASYVGVSTQYIVETSSGRRVSVYEQNVERTSHGSLHRPGDDVRLAWSPDHSFVVHDDSPRIQGEE